MPVAFAGRLKRWTTSIRPSPVWPFTRYQGRNLPHWRLAGATYAVTWKLKAGQPDLSVWSRFRARPTPMVSALRHFDGDRCELFAFVVMDDHVHALVKASLGDHLLEKILRSWKSLFTAAEFQKHEGRVGGIWQGKRLSIGSSGTSGSSGRNGPVYHRKPSSTPWPGIRGYRWVWRGSCRGRLGGLAPAVGCGGLMARAEFRANSGHGGPFYFPSAESLRDKAGTEARSTGLRRSFEANGHGGPFYFPSARRPTVWGLDARRGASRSTSASRTIRAPRRR